MNIADSLLILEALSYQFLEEGAREDYLLKTYGQKIEQELKTHPERGIDDATALIAKLSEADPGSGTTKKKIYTQWLLVRYLGGMLLEDLPKATKYLEIFDKYKSQLGLKDIFQYKSLPDLFRAIEQFTATDATGQTQERDEYASLYPKMIKQSTLLYDGGDLKVLSPNTKEAAQYFGAHTEWCTAYGGKWSNPELTNNMFDHYNDKGKLYIIIDKNDGKKWQLHFASWPHQYMDKNDDPINIGKLFEKFPVLYDVFENVPGVPVWLKKNPSEKECVDWLREYPMDLKNIVDKNQTARMQEVAVEAASGAIEFVKNPSDELCMMAIAKLPRLIGKIKNPTEEMKLFAVSKDAYALGWIKNPSVAVRIAAVEQSYIVIGAMKYPPVEVQLAAVKQNATAIGLIDHPCEQAQIESVRRPSDSPNIKKIKDPCEEAQLMAVRNDGRLIYYIENPSEEVQLAAVRHNPFALTYIKNPSETIQKEAEKSKYAKRKNIDRGW